MCNHYVVVEFVYFLIVSINMQRLTPLYAEILKIIGVRLKFLLYQNIVANQADININL